MTDEKEHEPFIKLFNQISKKSQGIISFEEFSEAMSLRVKSSQFEEIDKNYNKLLLNSLLVNQVGIKNEEEK